MKMMPVVRTVVSTVLSRLWVEKQDRVYMERLLALLMENAMPFVLAVVFMSLYNVMNAVPVWYTKDIVDSIRSGKVPTIDRFFLVGMGIFLVFALKGLFFFSHTYFIGLVGQRVIFTLRQTLYNCLHKFSFPFFVKTPVGEVISRFTYDTVIVQNAIQLSMIGPFRDLPMVCILMAILFYRSWQLFLLSVIIIPVAAVLIGFFGKKVKRATEERLKVFGKLTTLLNESIHGVRVIRAFGMQHYEETRFNQINLKAQEEFLKSVRVIAISPAILESVGALSGGCIILLGGWLIIQNSITPGDFVSYLLAFFLLNSPLKNLNRFNLHVQEGLSAVKRSFDMMDKTERETDTPTTREMNAANVTLRLCVRSFAHHENSKIVLKDVDITIPQGEMVALVGPSGSGKTTLVHLIPRFFDLKDGMIQVNGTNIKEYTYLSLRKHIAFVSQEIFLFNDTIANNIAYGSIHCSREQIIESAKQAYAHDFIEALPNGYDTMTGEGGITLSGGQRQRICIARALMKNAPILILDEATSALDVEAEQEIQKAVNAVVKNRTTIVIAHRLSTVQQANQIYVMSQGSVCEHGDHHALLEKGGLYSRLYHMQFRGNGNLSPAKGKGPGFLTNLSTNGRTHKDT